jgi:ankyrin repeat protein
MTIDLARRIVLSALALAPMFSTLTMAQTPAGQRLLDAASRGNFAGVERALRDGAPVDPRDGRGRTPLMLATHGDHVAVARALIAAGADVNAKDDMADSPFLYAGAEGRTEILKLTLAAGADLTSTNRYGGTALIPAAHHGHLEAVKVLLGTAIPRDHVNRLGWTALLEAVILGDGGPVHTEIVRLLLAGGANASIADHEGVTPLMHAHRRGFRNIERLLAQTPRR